MPREVSHILIGAVYHPPSSNNEGCLLLDHPTSRPDSTLTQELSFSGLLTSSLRSIAHLSIETAGIWADPQYDYPIDKIFTNIASWFQSPVILPAVTKSDHNTVLLAPIATVPKGLNCRELRFTAESLILVGRLCCAIISCT